MLSYCKHDEEKKGLKNRIEQNRIELSVSLASLARTDNACVREMERVWEVFTDKLIKSETG